MPIIKLTESYIGKNLQCPEGKNASNTVTRKFLVCMSRSVHQARDKVPTIYGIKIPQERQPIKRLPVPPKRALQMLERRPKR